MPITVLINRGEVSKQDSQREIHPLAARKELEGEYKWREKSLSDKEIRKHLQDPAVMQQQARFYKNNYEKGLPLNLSPMAKNELWKRAKLLKDRIVVGMVPKHELHPVKEIMRAGKTMVVADYDKLNATKAVERDVVWQKKNANEVRELKNILRQLEPDDPNFANLERFRP